MGANFNAAFFAANRERLRTLFTGTAPIVITANGLLQRNSDVNFPFRQDSTFWYLTGIDEPDVVLVMDKGKEYLIVPTRDERQAVFDGTIDASSLTALSGIDTLYHDKEGWKHLGSRLKKVKHIATVAAAPTYISFQGMYANPARARLLRKVRQHNPDVELLDLRPHITKMRSIKQPQELAAIQAAIDLTMQTLASLKRKGWQKFSNECQIDAAITLDFITHGAGHAYQPIIAAGRNACTLHYIANRAAIDDRSLLLLDVGAEVSHYAADITRTYAVSEPNKRQQQVYDTVLSVQQFAMDALKPGVLLRDYEDKVAQFMGEKLRELGLIKSIESDTVRQFYPHATSHFLGLDVHDIADYDRPLEPGMVLTVEPGIYIPGEEIGIRIEDDVLVEADGVKVLSHKLPRVLE